jgi:RNA polymerase sigma factor (TIGR02999 family)
MEETRTLIPALYAELHALASSYLRRERPGHTLQATALVNELYLKLSRSPDFAARDREHFLALAARTMRQILIDHARTHTRERRGGGIPRLPLHEEMSWIDAQSPDLLDLDAALIELEQFAPDKVRLFELYFFLGASAEEAASQLGLSRATVFRDLKFIRTWLHDRMRPA